MVGFDKKYKSGISKCFRNDYYATIPITNTWGSIYESTTNVGNIDYPTGLFTNIPVFQVTASKTTKYAIMGFEIDGGSLTTCPNIYALRPNTATIEGATIGMIVTGTWK